jgi:hypothetical protein
MTLKPSIFDSINQALSLLPQNMDSPQARVMILAIGLQESRFEYRRQIGDGPAKGFWQFERGGGVKGCIQHPASAPHIRKLCAARGVEFAPQAVWNAIEADDVLAAGLARLLLWTDPKPLPALGDADGAWSLYLRTWRPGKPHLITWSWIYRQALGAVS